MSNIIDVLTSVTPEVAQMSQRLFTLNASSACLSLQSMLGRSPESMALIVVRSAVPYNSAMRVDPSHDCSFVFFHDRESSVATMVKTARAMCAFLHNEHCQNEQREHYKNAGRTRIEMRKCCRIVSTAQLWLFHNRVTGDPLLPCCTREFHDAEEAPPSSIDDALSAYSLLEQQNAADKRPDVDRLSHGARICCAELEGLEKQLEATIPIVALPECSNCDNRRKGGTGDVRVPKGPFTLCRLCLSECLGRVKNLLTHARKEKIRCTRRQSCNCIYKYYSERCGAVIELDGVPRPTDDTYEQLADSIYDAQSPLVDDTLRQFPETMRRLVANARIGKLARQEPPQHLAGFGLTSDYDSMLMAARSVYQQPDARTLCEIALRNDKHEPRFGDKKSLDAALAWLPRCVQHAVRETTTDEVLEKAKSLLGPGQLLVSIKLERLLYEEMRLSKNRLMTMSRVVGLVLESPTTLHQYYGTVLWVAAFVGIIEVCSVTGQKVSEQKLAAYMEEVMKKHEFVVANKKRQRVVPPRQQTAPRSPERRKKQTASVHANRRLMARAREPPPPPLPVEDDEPATAVVSPPAVEQQRPRLVADSKEFVPMTPTAHQQPSAWLTATKVEPWPDDEVDIDEAAAVMTSFASSTRSERCLFLLGKSLWQEVMNEDEFIE